MRMSHAPTPLVLRRRLAGLPATHRGVRMPGMSGAFSENGHASDTASPPDRAPLAPTPDAR